MLPGGCVFLVAPPPTSLTVGGDALGAFSVVIFMLCSTLDAAGFAFQGRCSLHLPFTAAAVGSHRSGARLLDVEEQLLLNLFALAVVGILSIISGADCLALSIRQRDGGSVTGLPVVAQLLPIVTQLLPIVIQVMPFADL